MKQKLIKNKQQVGRFVIVGIANTIIDFVLLFILKAAGLPVVPANFISSTTAFVFSFTANKNYTFKDSGGDIQRQIILFIIITLIGLWLFQNIVIFFTEPACVNITGSNEAGLLISKLLATSVSMTWNYVMYAHVVFKSKTAE